MGSMQSYDAVTHYVKKIKGVAHNNVTLTVRVNEPLFAPFQNF